MALDAAAAPSSQPSFSPACTEDALSDSSVHVSSQQKLRARRKRAVDNASKRRLAAKEPAMYVDAVTKASKVKAAKLDLTGVSSYVAAAMAESGVLDRPPPAAIPKKSLRRLGTACRLQRLDALDAAVWRGLP